VNVLFVTNAWPTAERPWYGTFVESMAASMRAVGVDVDVFPIRGDKTRRAYLAAAREIGPRTARGGYDVLHAHYGHSGVIARLQGRVPVVVSYLGDDLLGTRVQSGSITPRSRVEAAVFRELARFCAATITMSEEMEGRLPRRCRARNHVIPNGVDLVRFAPRPREEARAELGWAHGRPVLLFAADPAVATKNFALAEAAHARAVREIGDLELVVAAGVPPAQMPTYMSAADALILTSRSEGSPNVVKEAMAAELPVVATPVGDVRERLDGVPGCFVRSPDQEALAEAVVAAVRHGRTPQARARVARVSLSAVAQAVLAIYEDVAGRPTEA
jgi:teichuronic acid biosynthesis glycosyltransferase TuaC